MAQPPQDVQLVAGPGQARDLQPVVVSAALPAPVAAPPAEGESENDQNLRWRVVCISALIAVYVVINAIVSYLFDMAAMQDTLETVREVAHFRGGPSSTALLLNMVPSVGMSITIGLVVPFCGYLGVKQSQKWLVGCFCSCNAIHCCCAILSMVCLFFFSMGVQALAPDVELFLEKCDPAQCKYLPDGTDADQDHVVDCLAAGLWKEYRPRFAEHRFPHKCPPIFLTCGDEPEAAAKREREETWASGQDSFDDADAPARAAHMGDFDASLASEVPVLGRHQNSRRLRFMDKKRSAIAFHSKSDFLPPMPENPTAECAPADKAITQFHQVRLLLPALLPKLQLFILVRCILMLPVVIFGCLGFCWGKDLFARLSDGYNPVGTSHANARPQVVLHPALGVVAAVPVAPTVAANQPLAQPLVLQVPPSPLPPITTSAPAPATSSVPGGS